MVRCKLIGKFTSGCNSFKYAIHLRLVDTVKVY
jgi:hypothetical protein